MTSLFAHAPTVTPGIEPSLTLACPTCRQAIPVSSRHEDRVRESLAACQMASVPCPYCHQLVLARPREGWRNPITDLGYD